jgi:hypothetical protein
MLVKELLEINKKIKMKLSLLLQIEDTNNTDLRRGTYLLRQGIGPKNAVDAKCLIHNQLNMNETKLLLNENVWLNTVNVYVIIIVLCISIDNNNIRTRSLRNTHSQETQHLSWETH